MTVAVIDTGTNPHNDLTKPNNRIVGFKDLINNKTSPYDDNGHGTQVPCTVNQKFIIPFYSFQYILITLFCPSSLAPISI